MSEQQNVNLIQKLFEAFGRGDVQTILDNCTSDCEFYCPGPAIIPYAGKSRGRSGIQAYFSALIGTQSNINLNIDQFVAQGATVVAIGHYTAHVTSTGKLVDSPIVLTFLVQGGKVKQHMVVGDTANVAACYNRIGSISPRLRLRPHAASGSYLLSIEARANREFGRFD